jgi:hypothetical protein
MSLIEIAMLYYLHMLANVYRVALLTWISASFLLAQFDGINGNKPILDAHNCYPYEKQWTDRIDRALSTGYPVAIEQDIALFDNQAVVTHTAKTDGSEPLLKDHFFERVRPIIEQALKENKRDTWPVIILHFDFKDNQPAVLHAVWRVLGEYRDWITTARKTSDPLKLMPLNRRPLLVLTEDSDEQEKVFFEQVRPGDSLRLFGSAHTNPITERDPAIRNRLLVTLPPERLLTAKPTNYRRWWNNSWYVVEEGGQPKAGDWTAEDAARLKALVDYAHESGFWIRFYTLDGFEPGSGLGWGESYNFGSRAAVEKRWRAALDAGVNLIATDQYEDLAQFMKR